jgi:hypothetical protein
VIDLIEGDLDCLIEDASEKPIATQSVEEMLLNREVLGWLRGGPLPGPGAVELLEENVAVFHQAPAEDEQANGKALRAALDELVRAQATARAAGSYDGDAAGPTERERRCFGKRLDELRAGRNMTIGELSARSGIDVVSIVALIHGRRSPCPVTRPGDPPAPGSHRGAASYTDLDILLLASTSPPPPPSGGITRGGR